MDGFIELSRQIRVREEKNRDLEMQLLEKKKELEELYFGRQKQIETQNKLNEFQYRRKKQYQNLYNSSSKIKFSGSQSLSMLNLLHGQKAIDTEHSINRGIEKINLEIERVQNEIAFTQAEIRITDTSINDLYYKRNKMSN